ncbi:MAG: DUF1800 family protein, partial [Hyphomicrobiales bacterium]|nr:DUF1800 family protein [Hyphomicrobiales bacterium]
MAVGPDTAEAVKAFNRFGLGARPGGLAFAASDPRGFLLEELWTANVALIRDRVPPSGATALQAFYLDRERLRVARMKAAATPPAQTAASSPVALLAAAPAPGASSRATSSALAMAPLEPARGDAPSMAIASALPQAPSRPAPERNPAKPAPPKPSVEQALFRAEAKARLLQQVAARAGFVERLIAFWSNHFAVSAAKSGELRVAAGPFEREAIRPHALGKFAALLRAAESHPAMILYLDNQN